MEIRIYFEQVLIDNLLMDFSLLLCTKILLGRKQKKLRIFLGGTVGAIYACFMPVVPIMDFLLFKFTLPVIMTAVAFASKKQKGYITATLVFIGLTVISGGAAFFLSYMINADMLVVPSGVVPIGVGSRGIVWGLSAVALTTSGVMKLIKSRRRVISGEAELVIYLKETELKLNGFIDSGNCLKDGSTGLPVAVVSRNAVDSILSEDFVSLLEGQIPHNMTDIHIIGYTGVAQSGVLYGFKPQRIQVIKEGLIYNTDCILAISSNKSFCGEYEAVIHPDMLEEVAG